MIFLNLIFLASAAMFAWASFVCFLSATRRGLSFGQTVEALTIGILGIAGAASCIWIAIQ